MSEPPEIRLKRLRLRSVRRGIREMDLLLGRFAEGLDRLTATDLDGYERLLEENDQDLLAWVTGLRLAPADHAPLLARIASGSP